MSTRPRVFVASSKEAERLARAVQQNLEEAAEVTTWTQDVFQIAQNTIDELVRASRRFEFAVFVFSPDDKITIRGKAQQTVRDNVILELGMFIGRLGKARCFIVKPRQAGMRLPTDLLGVVTGEYDAASLDNPRSALGSVCTQIQDAIERQLKSRSVELYALIENSLETVCRAMSVPTTPEQASLRAFIFRKEGDELVCRYFWDPNPSDEEVGRTRFEIKKEAASRIVVVRCYLDNAMRRTERSTEDDVKPLPAGFKEAKGKVKPSLRYVLAAPIRDRDERIWGVVDFDASNETGKALLQNEFSNTVIMRLATHLSSVLC
jgi:Predicted nucleotide-binding protein containing TIR-like domain